MCQPIRVAIPGYSPAARCDTDDSLEKSDLEGKLLSNSEQKHSPLWHRDVRKGFLRVKALKKTVGNFKKHKKVQMKKSQQKVLEADIKEGRRKKVSRDTRLMFTSDCRKTESCAALLSLCSSALPTRHPIVSARCPNRDVKM